MNDGALAEAIGKKTAVILKADAGYLPLFWHGLTVRSYGLLVRGQPSHGLTELRASNLRAACSLHNLWQRKFVITRLEADELEVAFGAAAAKNLKPILSAQPTLQPQVEQPAPLKLEIRETIVRQMNVFRGRKPEVVGGARGVLTKFYPNESNLDAIGTGGILEQAGWPALRIVQIETHYAKPKLEIRSARLAIGKSEDTTARGGYLWTTMKLSGPLKHPREDLKERLVAAAEENLAKGFLAPLFKPGKVVLGLLNALYQ